MEQDTIEGHFLGKECGNGEVGLTLDYNGDLRNAVIYGCNELPFELNSGDLVRVHGQYFPKENPRAERRLSDLLCAERVEKVLDGKVTDSYDVDSSEITLSGFLQSLRHINI
tara:strand:+ start:692 stop:1027 length:336 start_codon:yes stop_codon:yes gene_type:complete